MITYLFLLNLISKPSHIIGGQLVSSLIDAGFVHVHEGWRWMLGLGAVPGFLQFIGMLTIVPESPRWLMKKGREEKARKILIKLNGECRAREEINEIRENLKGGDVSFKDLFAKRVRPALFIGEKVCVMSWFIVLLGVGLQAFQQFCGINTAM